MQARIKTQEHFLLVHDALHAIRPDCVVNAFAVNRRMFDADMNALFPTHLTEQQALDLATSMMKKLPRASVDVRLPRLRIAWGPDVTLHLVVGKSGYTMADLNSTPDEALRDLIRPSFGVDAVTFRETMPRYITDAAQVLRAKYRKQLLDEAVPNYDFMLLLAYDTYMATCKNEEVTPYRITNHATEHFRRILADTGAFHNPLLPGEDMTGIASVGKLRDCLFPPVRGLFGSFLGMIHPKGGGRPPS